MIVTKVADLRYKQKEYFDKAYDGETVVVSRPKNRNIVIVSEQKYNKLQSDIRILEYAIRLFKLHPEWVGERESFSDKDKAVLQLLMELEKGEQLAETDGWLTEGELDSQLKSFMEAQKLNV